MEPTVDAIGAAATALKVERITGFDRLPDRGERMWPVIRMKRVSLSPPSQFLDRLAKIFQVVAIAGVQFTGRCPKRDESRNAIDDSSTKW